MSTPVRAVVELFRGPFAGVRFPDVDNAQLEALVDQVVQARQAVDAARAALGSAQGALDEAIKQLGQQAERAHAYARIFAEGDPDLAEHVSQIPSEAPERVRRKASAEPRRRKSNGKSGPELPLAGARVEAVVRV
ncbi:MAG: hypothetical protein KC933_02245 [Myxococcales bacterium]|nr:hypothetical protein [Myxococcales bacterium]